MLFRLIASVFFFVTIQTYAAETPPPATVLVKKAIKGELFDRLSYPARIVSKVNTTLRSEIDGIVGKVVSPLGSRVRKGQVILSVRHTDPVYEYAPFVVRAPVAGVVSSVPVSEGSQVIKGQELATVVDPSHVHALIEVPAADLTYMQKGLKGTLSAASQQPGAVEVPVRVKGVSAWVDPTSGTASAELEIEKPATPGVMGEAYFKVNLRQGISLPETSLVYKGKEPFVRLVQEGKIKKVAVTLGRRSRDNIEILQGVPEGADVVERASRFVADGESVTIQSGEGK